jgi:G3E family GTPase
MRHPSPPLHILTGFLGSGKTTLLRRLLQRPEMAATAVLINEYGEAAIDHLIVESIDEDIVVLESGCVCCALRDDLTASLMDLCRKRDAGALPAFGRVVLETTGIADPAAILQLLMNDAFVCGHFRLGSVTTVVDVTACAGHLAAHPVATRQIATASRLVLSKCDLAGPGERDGARRIAAAINGTAQIAESPGAGADELLRALDEELAPAAVPIRAPRGEDVHGYQTFRLGWREPVSREALEDWLSGLLYARGDDILRLKGFAQVEGEELPVLIQGVGRSLFAPEHLRRWPHGRRTTEFTFITRHFSARAARRSLEPFFTVELEDAGTPEKV